MTSDPPPEDRRWYKEECSECGESHHYHVIAEYEDTVGGCPSCSLEAYLDFCGVDRSKEVV
jgi:hypothetical protein